MELQPLTSCMDMVSSAISDVLGKSTFSFSCLEADQQQLAMNALVNTVLLSIQKIDNYTYQQQNSLLGVHENENMQLYILISRQCQDYLVLLKEQRGSCASSSIQNMTSELAHMKKKCAVPKRWQSARAELMDICQAVIELALESLRKLSLVVRSRSESETKKMMDNHWSVFSHKNHVVKGNFKAEMLDKLEGKAIDAAFFHAQKELVYSVLSPKLQRMARDYKGNLLLLVQQMQGNSTDEELDQILLVYLKEDVLVALFSGVKEPLNPDEKFIQTMNHIQQLYPKMAKYTYIGILQKMNKFHLMPEMRAKEYKALLRCCEIPADRFPGKTSLKKLYLKHTDGPELVVLMNADKLKILNEICDAFVAYFLSL